MPAIVLVEAGASRGSGFFITPDTLLTNVHVVKGNSSVTIRRASGEVVPARVERTATDVDVAVLKISPADPKQPTLTMGATADARVGQEVFAIGTALGLFQNTLTRGIVSGIRQTPHGHARPDRRSRQSRQQRRAADRPHRQGARHHHDGVHRASGTELRGGHRSRARRARRRTGSGDAAAGRAGGARNARPVAGDRIRHRAAARRRPACVRGRDRHAWPGAPTRWRARGAPFASDCYRGRIVGTFDRDGSRCATSGPCKAPSPPGCGGWFTDLRREADEVRAGVIGAEEAARRADVFPESAARSAGGTGSTIRARSGSHPSRPSPFCPSRPFPPFLPCLPCYDRAVRIGIDARKLHDFGIGTYIRNLLRQLARLDRDTEFVLLCRPDDRASAGVARRRTSAPVAETAGNYSVAEQLKIPLALQREGVHALPRAALRAAAARAAAGRW